jgi:hypothetical protein
LTKALGEAHVELRAGVQEVVGGRAAGPFEDLEVIRQDAGMPTARFCTLIGIPGRKYARWQAVARAGATVKSLWPAPVVDAAEPVVARYTAGWPGWGPPQHPRVDARRRA